MSTILHTLAAPFLIDRYHIVMHGPESCGKTTLLYRLKMGNECQITVPTISFNRENVHLGKLCMLTMWDIGCTPAMRQLLPEFILPTHATPADTIQPADGILVVVPRWSSSVDAAIISAEHTLAANGDLKVPILVLLSEFDQDLARHTEEIAEVDPQIVTAELTPEMTADLLDLHKLTVPWVVKPANIWTGKGIPEALGWLTKACISRRHGHVTRTIDRKLQRFEDLEKIGLDSESESSSDDER
ncbi:Small GTPase superfamily, ARF/SAR type [Carpediemonas membranifera]|uniref:Small GTPase superfamily, ARF/SAR type n=1 Tax=Carpediemonas membranifera TaxID=201153 RepID=A0A8J6E4B6_9EUKA|nr:Small GTPase superfamily, ARF/SAR type [Carpediemonas membranifera]|eukprot:KAG9396716.1 Small GTPase superfamily, ARF/SAR type [Carpediemonas membranifera]